LHRPDWSGTSAFLLRPRFPSSENNPSYFPQNKKPGIAFWSIFADGIAIAKSSAQEQKMNRSQAKTKAAHWRSQNGLVAAMMEPGFYPKPPPEVSHKETHISHLLFAGDLVYKIKKPVRFSFLDYSTLGKRRHFLQEELRLNRRLAPSVYLAVMPIAHDGSGWRLGGWGPPEEYTLIMRRLPERRMLPFLLDSNQLTPEMMRAVAEVLAPFHAQAARVCEGDAHYYPWTVQKQWVENLTDLQPFVGTLFEVELYGVLKQFGAQFIRQHHDLLIRRFSGGWIRDVHGDLHCEHVCFAPEGIQIYDCIEFSPELRTCDLASEVAFFTMDLEVRGGGSLVRPFLTRYLEILDDSELRVLLPFYQCYRALVRGKVAAIRSHGGNGNAMRYFRYAARMTWGPFKPFLVILSGLTGSGKSTLARELSERLGLPVISSDVIRKTIAGKSGRMAVAFNEGIYSPTMTKKTYAMMAREAEKEIVNGTGAILDATFIHKNHREQIIRVAQKRKVPFFIIHCSASDETTQMRLAQRTSEGKDISDGRWEIYIKQKATQQPFSDIPPDDCLELDTEPSVEQLARVCERFLRSRIDHARAES
jgi:aminoglycoside phosphotransferase family enzyme/predicted kinase